jgi:hypothetical protein
MQHTPQRATAIACLLRAVIALLATRPYALSLIDWGRELHDRFALPFYLQADLDTVLAELEAAGLGLRSPSGRAATMRSRPGGLALGTLELWRGLEFWPLVAARQPRAKQAAARRASDPN